jgi:uncharacterized protein (DUF58 family)
MLSDFLDEGYEAAFRLAGRKHDLIAVRVADPRERELPDAGLLQVEDAETGRQLLIDTRSTELRRRFAARGAERHEALTRLTRSCQVDLIDVSTDGRHFDALVRFFQMRERRRRHAP